MAPTNPMDLINNVQLSINLLITNPPKIVLISGIPECFAYGAKCFTRRLAQVANVT